jgi:hypothetical protein
LEHANSETGRAIDALRVHLAHAATGCLRVRIPTRGECAVYLMDGEVIAALTPADPVDIVDRLLARGRLSATVAAELKGGNQGAPLHFEALHQQVDPALVGRLMAGRFRNNLIVHLFDGGRFVYESAQTVRVPHLQIGHDSAGLLRELEVVHERILPWLDLGGRRTITPGDYSPGSPQQRHIQALCTSGTPLDRLLTLSPFSHAQTLLLVDSMSEAGSLVVSTPSEGPQAGAINHAIAEAEAKRRRRSEASQARDESGLNVRPLVAFGDHEGTTRGMGKGAFVGDKDRVDLGQGPALRAPGLRLSAPKLSSSEVLRRIGVCNEVLTALVQVWTDQHGMGSGRATAQILVDGAPRDSAALFQSVSVDAMGRIGATEILGNLEQRPEGERRELVTKGLSSLIDRALSRAAEGLDEDGLNRMLTQVAGYRSRMGW